MWDEPIRGREFNSLNPNFINAKCAKILDSDIASEEVVHMNRWIREDNPLA